ncbi:stage III sporulation protein AC [Anoxybacter fermentans]|uniref:Stage III sporulation protein AC n=1 Tax=Anoxybacter fermentans TaxID=1323375 RepID=A0A3S9SZ23_9FIRM|nr:stage III sporulation protein AC [Anoxybacter fermentans]AZR73549.1 stage III sporulation protein AC [Anoxybacter fermentans]
MQIDLIFKLAGLGIFVAVIKLVLDQADKKEIAQMVTLSAVLISFFWVVRLISQLFGEIRAVFGL